MLLQPDQHPVSVCKELLFFFVYCWEQASKLSDWIDGTGEGATKVAGHATAAGAITFVVVGAVAVLVFLSRKKLSPVVEWAKKHPIIATSLAFLFAIPLATAILICLVKYLTFASALATTIGVLVALDNNNKSHKREEKKFNRQAMAARSALALELSVISAYCAEVAEILSRAVERQSTSQPHKAQAVITPPELPKTSIATLKEMINSTEHEHVADRCALLLGQLQIVGSGVKEFQRSVTTYSSDVFLKREMRIAFLSIINNSLYEFSRKNDLKLGSIEWDALDIAVKGLQLPSSLKFNEPLKRYRSLYSSPLEMFSSPVKVVFAEGEVTVSPTEPAYETPAPEVNAAVEPEPPASAPEVSPKPAAKKVTAPKAATKAPAKSKASAKVAAPKSPPAKAAEPEVPAQKVRKPRTRKA